MFELNLVIYRLFRDIKPSKLQLKVAKTAKKIVPRVNLNADLKYIIIFWYVLYIGSQIFKKSSKNSINYKILTILGVVVAQNFIFF